MVKLLRLNVVSLHDIDENEFGVNTEKRVRDMYGRNAEFYEDIGMEAPEHMFKSYLDEEDEGEEGEFDEDEELETVTVYPTILDLTEFSFCINNSSIGSSLFTKGGEIINVYETSDQVYAQVEYLNMNWIEKLINKIKYVFSKESR